MKILTLFLMIYLFGCTSKPVARVNAGPQIMITEINPNKWTALTRQNIEHLIKVYHISPLFFTKNIQIQSRVIPHSHPVLTLNTRYAEQPHKLLSVLLHEQLHWWAEQRKIDVAKAMVDLKLLFPTLPSDGVAKDSHSTYLHMVVCFLEFESLVFYLGKIKANEIVRELIGQDKVYPWIYTQVLNRYREINRIVLKYNLKPDPLKSIVKPKRRPQPRKS